MTAAVTGRTAIGDYRPSFWENLQALGWTTTPSPPSASRAVATLLRTVGNTAAALVCVAAVRHVEHPFLFAARLGIVTGIVTGAGIGFSPCVEYYADNLPERRLGVFGIGLMFCGFAMQSLQYWLAIFDVHLT